MARPCSICQSSNREAIDAAIIDGVPLLAIAKRYAIDRKTIFRHRGHMGHDVQAALQARPIRAGESIIERLRALNREASEILAEARTAGQRRDAIAAIRALSDLIELEARLLGELDERPQQNVQIAIAQTPEWARIREAIATALEPYPEARMALSAALESMRG